MRKLTEIAVLGLVGLACFAQTAQITGRVSDSSGGVVPSAEVTVTNSETGNRFPVQTNTDGYFTVSALIPGRYQVEVKSKGFKTVTRSGLTLEVDQVARLDFTLEVGAVTDTVLVTAEAPLVESETSDVGQVVNNKSIVEMPLNGRNAWDLSALVGGVVYTGAGGDGGEIANVSIAGSRPLSQSYTLDGGSVQKSGLSRSQSELAPMVDSIQEFKVITNNYAAEYGRSSAGVFTAVTKSGTNQFRGNLFEFLRNDTMDARNFFALTKAPLRYNQFGGTVGGPIRRNKIHFFSALENTRATTGSTVLLTVPTVAQRGGNFSTLVNAQGRAIPLYNPFSVRPDPANPAVTTRDPFPGNVIPASVMDPVGVKLASFYPDPNVPGTNLAGANNRNINVGARRLTYNGTMKVDVTASEKDRLFARYANKLNETPAASVYPEPAASGLGPVTRNIWNLAHTYMASWVRSISPAVLNDLKWSGTNQHRSINHPSAGGNWPEKLGLQGVGQQAFPRFNPAGYSALGALQVFREQTNPYWHLTDSVSYYRRNHSFKAGAEYRRNRTTDEFDTSPSGNFTIPIAVSGLPGNANTGNGIASLLLGQVSQAALIDALEYRFHNHSLGLYLQDDWKVTPRLTLNIGVRYDIENARIPDDKTQNGFDLAKINPVAGVPGVVTFAGVNGVPLTAWDTDKNNFAPRFGFAWRAFGTEKTVVRGGLGLFYGNPNDQGLNNDAVLGFATNVLLVSANGEQNSTLLLRNGFSGVNPPTAKDRTDGFGISGPVDFYQRERASPYSMQFNFGLQQTVGSVLISGQYLGNISHKLTALPMSMNQIAPDKLLLPGTQQSRRPFPQFTDVVLDSPNLGSSTYHAFLLRLEKRYRNGLQFLGNYAFSKFLDNVDPVAGDFGGTPGNGYSDYYNRGLDKSLSPNDIHHLVSFNTIYDLPWGPHRRWLTKGVASQILGGWEMTTLGVVRTGPPYGVQTTSNTCNCFSAGPLRPDLLRDPELSGDRRTVNQWFDIAAFAQPAAFRFGTAARAVGRAPGAYTVNVGLMKNFQIQERFRLQVRTELFNVFNHANFGIPNNTMGASTFGTITSAADPRILQLGLKLYF